MSFLDADNAINLIAGASKSFALTVTDDDGLPVDLTGARILLSVKANGDDRAPVIVKDSGVVALPEGVLIPRPRAGEAVIRFFPGDTRTLPAGTYLYDCWVILADGSRVPVIPQSTLEVEAPITRLPA